MESGQAFRAVFVNPQLRKLQLAFAGSVTGQWGYLVALAVYANDHGGRYPDRPEELLATDITPEIFVCPSTEDVPATGATTRAVSDALRTT